MPETKLCSTIILENLQQLWTLSKLLQNLNILHCCWDQYENDSTVGLFIFQWLQLRLGPADDDYDIDSPGQFVLNIMMMLVLTIMMMLMLLVNLCSPLWWCCWWRWGSTAEYQLRGQWWKWGLNFTAAVFTSSTPFPSYWSVMELMEFILTWWRVYIRIVICCLTTTSYQLKHSAMLILKKWP